MADASGQGFTASIVNGTPNYLLADRSVLGQVDGTTGSIQYVKLVWGGSGEANLITDQGSDPTPLPVSLNNSENWFLLDAILDTVKADAGPTAVNVNIVNSTGLCFGNITLQVSSAVQISGATGAAQGAGSNLGVTFGGITVGPLRVRNFISGSGVTEAIAVTFGGIGGTVNVNNLNVGNLNLGASGIAISGWCGGVGASLPVYIVGGSFSIGSVNANLGSTIGVVLSNSNGSFVGTSGGIFYGLPVVNAANSVLGVSFSGTPSVSISGIPSVSISGTPTVSATISGTPSVSISGTPTVSATISGTPSVSATISGTPSVSATISGTPTVGIQPVSGKTFPNVLTDNAGSPVGYSGGTFFGYPVQIVGGLSLSGLTIAGMTVSIPSSFSITGGTLNAITILGGTFTALNIGNISGGSINVGNFPATQNVKITNASNDPGVVQLSSFNSGSGNVTLKDHLDGLGVNVSGLNLSGGLSISDIGATISINPGLCGSSSKGLGVSFGNIKGEVTLPNTQIVNVKGDAASLTTSPVGITLTGRIAGLSAVGICGACAALGTILPSAVFGYSSAGSGGYIPVGMSGDALKVAIEGVGLCLGSVTVSGVCFGNGITLLGGTAGFLNVLGGTFAVLNIGNISGGTISIGNTVGVTGTVAVRNGRTAGSSLSGPLFVDLVDTDGTSIIKTTGLLVTGSTGMVPIGITWATAASILVTGGNITIRPQAQNTGAGGLSGGGTTFNAILTNMAGIPLGFSGSTFVGIPTQISNIANYGVIGSTDRTLGVALFGSGGVSGYIPVGMSGDALKVSLEGVGLCLGSVTVSGLCFGSGVTLLNGITLLGGTAGFLNVLGGTFAVLNIGNISGGTISIGNTVGTRPGSLNTGVGGLSGGGTTFNVILTNVAGVPIGYGLSGSTATFLGFPVFGVTGATAVYTQETGSIFGTTGFHSSQPGGACGGTVSFLRISPVRGVDGEPGVTLNGKVFVIGDSNSGIGVTFPSISIGTITNAVNVSTESGTTLSIAGDVRISPIRSNTGSGGMSGGGTTFNVILTNVAGVPIGNNGLTFVGIPIVGVSGATAMGVTFGPVSFGTVGMGVTFAGITFATTRTIISGSAFADGGGNLGIPVFGVAGTTAVRVSIEGGTVAGIFVTDAPGITIMGISSGIPVIGVSGGQPIAVTFAAAPAPSLNFPTSGITIASIASGASVTVSGSVGLASGAIVAVRADTSSGQMADADKIIAESIGGNKALITMEKRGPVFARGLTIGPFLLSSSTAQPNTVGVSGGTFYYWSTTPYPVTRNYSGPGYEDSGSIDNSELNPKVNLKHGLYIQLTKWDLISHVLIGYTAANEFEFDRNAQVLYKEYQVAPIWSHALDQFRRFPGYRGNNTPISDLYGNTGSPDYDPSVAFTAQMAQKQYIGVIEKPSRIFIPTYDAGKVYIKVKGDYQSHAIGSGFWDQETGAWSSTTLYERSFYARNVFGFTGSNVEPNLSANGNSITDEYDYAGPGPVAEGPNPPVTPTDLTEILQSYAQNPFIRIWGY